VQDQSRYTAEYRQYPPSNLPGFGAEKGADLAVVVGCAGKGAALREKFVAQSRWEAFNQRLSDLADNQAMIEDRATRDSDAVRHRVGLGRVEGVGDDRKVRVGWGSVLWA